MTVHYQYVFDDYGEASWAIAQRQPRNPGGWPTTLPPLICLGLALAAGLWARNPEVAGGIVLLFAIAPVLLTYLAGFVVRLVFSHSRGRPLQIVWRDVPALVLFLVPAGLVVIELVSGSVRGLPDFPTWGWSLSAHITWVGLVISMTIQTQLKAGVRWHGGWTDQPGMHRAKTADITADGVAVSDSVSRWEMRWDGFVGRQETKSLFLLFMSPTYCLFIPKRAFPGEEEIRAMRVLTDLIPQGATGGFPIHAIVNDGLSSRVSKESRAGP